MDVDVCKERMLWLCPHHKRIMERWDSDDTNDQIKDVPELLDALCISSQPPAAANVPASQVPATATAPATQQASFSNPISPSSGTGAQTAAAAASGGMPPNSPPPAQQTSAAPHASSDASPDGCCRIQ